MNSPRFTSMPDWFINRSGVFFATPRQTQYNLNEAKA
jgi:hypothetical protein